VAFTWKNQEGWPVEFVTENVENLFGYTAKEFMTGKANYTDCVHPEDLQRVAKEVAEYSSKEETAEFIHEPYRIIAKDGSEKIISDWTYTVRDNEGRITHYKGIVEDITERKRAEEENEKLQAQFRQAQKMEAIGTLAGGVAHDFNNILTAIIGNAELILMDLGKEHPLREEIKEIKKAGERAASLTRQLLAFSRKQVIKPEVLDLNQVITATEKMLKRLIGNGQRGSGRGLFS
jgi:two-component system cell cycle sensor histidine kinase/response regulator CckA